MLRSVASQVLQDAGYTVGVTEPSDGTVCAVLTDAVDIADILVPSAMLAKYNEMVAHWALVDAEIQAHEAAQEAERASNPYCKKSIEEVEALMQSIVDDATTTNERLQALYTIIKGNTRCDWAHRR